MRKLLDSGLLREPGMDGERGSNGVTGESEVEGRRRGVLVLGNYLVSPALALSGLGDVVRSPWVLNSLGTSGVFGGSRND